MENIILNDNIIYIKMEINTIYVMFLKQDNSYPLNVYNIMLCQFEIIPVNSTNASVFFKLCTCASTVLQKKTYIYHALCYLHLYLWGQSSWIEDLLMFKYNKNASKNDKIHSFEIFYIFQNEFYILFLFHKLLSHTTSWSKMTNLTKYWNGAPGFYKLVFF